MLKFKAIKATPPHQTAMLKVLRDEAKNVAKFVKLDFDHITDSWEGERPEWKIEYGANQYQLWVKIMLADPESEGAKKWLWLDEGTKPHAIPSGKPTKMTFVWGGYGSYKAGSRPGSIRTSKGESTGEIVTFASVKHPGIQARGWSDKLKENWEEQFKQMMDAAFADVAKVSGHSI